MDIDKLNNLIDFINGVGLIRDDLSNMSQVVQFLSESNLLCYSILQFDEVFLTSPTERRYFVCTNNLFRNVFYIAHNAKGYKTKLIYLVILKNKTDVDNYKAKEIGYKHKLIIPIIFINSMREEVFDLVANLPHNAELQLFTLNLLLDRAEIILEINKIVPVKITTCNNLAGDKISGLKKALRKCILDEDINGILKLYEFFNYYGRTDLMTEIERFLGVKKVVY